jgi:hypothetical protein
MGGTWQIEARFSRSISATDNFRSIDGRSPEARRLIVGNGRSQCGRVPRVPRALEKTETLLARVKRGPASDVVIAGTANDARGALRGTSSAAAAPLS